MKKDIFKSALTALLLFVVHSIVGGLIFMFRNEDNGLYGFWGGVIFGFIFGFWLYWLLCYIYLRLSGIGITKQKKYYRASMILGFGYLISRTGDILDNDFFNNFSFYILLLFLATIPLLVEISDLIRVHKKPMNE